MSAASTLGKYQVIAKIGRGGMAEVDLALWNGPSGFNKLVVIKRILPKYADEPEFLSMFLDEARLAARLNHPNVVQTNEAGCEDGHHFMVMEYLCGQPLSRILGRLGHGGLPLPVHLRILADLLAGLHYAHELMDYDGAPLGVVHRDVSPPNVFITYDGMVKVVDFGIAKAKSSICETHAGVVKGKITYMAPEQARREHLDRRADIFSVGVMLWEAATGTRPWSGVTSTTILTNILTGKFPPPRTVEPSVSERLEAIIMKALAHDREERYATAADFQADIESYLHEIGEHVLPRDVGKVITKAFAKERADVTKVIEQRVQLLKARAAKDASPGLEPPATCSTPPAEQVTFKLPRGDSRPDSQLDSRPDSHPDLPLDPRHDSRPDTSGPPPAVTAPPRPASTGQRLAWMTGGACALATLLVAGLWGFPTHGQHGAVAEAAASTFDVAAPTATAIAEAAPPPRADMELSISASPPEAIIYLDGKLLAGNPFKGRFLRDEGTHELRIEAPGRAPRIEEIELDRDRAIERVLARQDTSVKPPPRPVGAPVGQKHRLDTINPYDGTR